MNVLLSESALLEDEMKRLKYFVVCHNNKDDTVIVYDPESITTYQARYAACVLRGGWDFLFTTTKTGNEKNSVVQISPVSSFERAFRSVLSYMEKLPTLHKKDRPEERVGKTYVWRIDISRDLKNGKVVYPCDPLRKVCDEEYISPILTAIEGDTYRPIDPTDKKRLRILKRLSVHSGGMTRQELADDFYTNYLKVEQLEQWGNTPYKVDLEHADIIPVEFGDEKKLFRPVNLENKNYDFLHFIAQDELEENNLYTLTPDNLEEMKPLLEIISDRYTIQPTVVGEKHRLHVTVL